MKCSKLCPFCGIYLIKSFGTIEISEIGQIFCLISGKPVNIDTVQKYISE
jgi:hypothetical protein